MPGERRNLRSNNKESSPSTNGEKASSDSQSSSSNKDKSVPTRTSSKGTVFHSKEVSINSAVKDAAGDKPHTNGAEPVENGVNGLKDVDMTDDGQDHGKPSINTDGDDSMLVVVPTPKSKPSGEPVPNIMDDVPMENTETNESDIAETEKIDTKVKALTDIKANFTLLERAVAQFDARFTLRVLRSMSSVRKFLSPDLLAQVITETYTSSNTVAKSLLAAIDRENTSFEAPDSGSEMDIDVQGRDKSHPTSKPNGQSKEVIPEVDLYLSILIQIHLYDTRAIELGAKFSSNVVGRLRTLNRRTLDSLAARVYFYYSLFFEQLAPLPPSPLASVVSIRQNLLTALRTSVLRKDQDTRATVTTLLLRNYLSTAHISQADLLISHSEFPPTASSNQIARYLYYLGRIRAIQLSYTEAHEHLIGATRKSPATPSAGGFYQASTKLLIIVELLMGDIPDRAIFRQPSLERAMKPYLNLVQAVRVGKIDGFLNVVQTYNAIFRRDGTYTLILRLRQNVIKTGIRMMSLSYARISLRDICYKLDLESEESAEYIVAKAIRDGVIEATLDHERGFMKSKEVGDIYATREPGEAFHERIRACLDLHDESVKAMRFPMNQHRMELKNAQEARERERELAKEIVEGDMDDDEAGGDFEGM
ncbi:26S proteasome non-ATPase regulatory subunit [Sticta canariensis]|nr:26S proteasome non-ATPase regulatory subunit [Sticta canariensis]